MYVLAVLLVLVGLGLQGSQERRETHRDVPNAIELACTEAGVEVRRGAAAAGPDGVVMRFAHTEGDWVMTWEGAPGSWSSSGSAQTAEMVWPVPPGSVRVQCYPGHLSLRDPSHEARWWADVEVVDPAGHYRRAESSCRQRRAASWHGRAVPVAQERAIVVEALGMLDAHQRAGDELVRLGYPQGIPRDWGLLRDGEVIANVRMAMRSDGQVSPSGMSACADGASGQSSTS
ncbi:MAG TPA: hypothetical protein VNU01_11705 [Egibacteraceae bacterium]|nr:hypothetical protein [Egibacteraceae bacterium]